MSGGAGWKGNEGKTQGRRGGNPTDMGMGGPTTRGKGKRAAQVGQPSWGPLLDRAHPASIKDLLNPIQNRVSLTRVSPPPSSCRTRRRGLAASRHRRSSAQQMSRVMMQTQHQLCEPKSRQRRTARLRSQFSMKVDGFLSRSSRDTNDVHATVRPPEFFQNVSSPS